MDKESKEHSIFLLVRRSAIIKLVKTFTDAVTFDSLLYDDLVSLVKEYYDPSLSPNLKIQLQHFF